MNSKIEFLLHEFHLGGRVSGRNCDLELPLGTVFTALCRRDWPTTVFVEEVPDPAAFVVAEISLRLDAIEWYRQAIDSIPPAHTALLTLSGTGLNIVEHVLSGAPKHATYSLCTADENTSVKAEQGAAVGLPGAG